LKNGLKSHPRLPVDPNLGFAFHLAIPEICMEPRDMPTRSNNMTKPIVYHSFEEKAVLEKKLSRRVSKNDAKKASIALMSIFFLAGKKRRAKKVLKSK
jgi:hypothetical protein